ncbi:MAG: DHH family phosphoesterase, partial [Actinobacteria bacterium]|nr:DHH family phosphoesterase [Actinomycetota bacterium]
PPSRPQPAPGIEEAAVLEIIDHHRVGDVQTSGPILFMNMPVGSTATIVALRYEHLGVKPTEQMAALMLSAVMTDTVLLKSPTATEVDRQVASRLADILGVHPMEFGIEVLKSRDSSMPFSAERAVTADLKEYRIGDSRIAISQMETADLPNVMSNAKDIRAAMERLREFQGYDLVLMMITDVIQEGSEVMAVGRIRLAERALGVSFSEGSVWIDGLLSRKKQIAERLLDAANS